MADQGERIHYGRRGGGADDPPRLTWPAENSRFVFEPTDSIGNAAWLAVDIRPVQISQMMVADLLIAEAGMRFFRVRN